jgi:N-acetylglucosamine malate deacetylase 2
MARSAAFHKRACGSLKTLVIVAHPDDEVLGCGGVICWHKKNGDDITIVIAGEGITSRYSSPNAGKRSKEYADMRLQPLNAAKHLGVSKSDICTLGLPDNMFDTVGTIHIVRRLERIVKKIQPDRIYTHFPHDLNRDHQLLASSVLPLTEKFRIPELFFFETPSSTEWFYPFRMLLTAYCDITPFMTCKIRAMNVYKTEVRPYPHPRALRSLTIQARAHGIAAGCTYAEAFMCFKQTLRYNS